MIKTLRSSLSFRLLLLLALVAVLIIVILDQFSDWVERTAEEEYRFNSTLAKFLLYIEEDVGYPPDYQKAQQIANMIDIDLAIVSHEHGNWPDDEIAQSFVQIPLEPAEVDALPTGYGFASYNKDGDNDDDETYSLTTPNQTIYISWSYSLASLPGFNRALLTAVSILLVIILCCYLIIRYLISPLKLISRNVQRFSRGELHHRISTKRQDDLGELAAHINSMEDQITSMLDAKRQLLLGISHELRTPLTRAKLSLAMLPDSQISQDLERDLNEMEAQISDVLESERLNSQHQALNLAPASINQLVQAVIATYFDTRRFKLTVPDDDPYVLIDAPRIRLLIKNLLANAVKYGGEAPIELAIGLTGSELLIKVSDQGPGISEEHIKYLTEPFYRPDTARTRASGGAGLGLYLCRLIADAHGGELQIRSTVGAGSEFSVALPLSPSQ